ncbi:hypothetical protein ACNKHO_01335 [Shigella flexneri]
MAETDQRRSRNHRTGRIGRSVSANMILPYPPGVPLSMPGEMMTDESRSVLDSC